MLFVREHIETETERVDERIDRTVAFAVQECALAVAAQTQRELLNLGVFAHGCKLMRHV